MIRNLKWKALLVVVIAGISIWLFYPPQEKINLGLDLQGGLHLVFKVDTSKLPQEAKADAPERALEVIRNRIDQFGVREPLIQKQGVDGIVVQLPGITDRKRALDLIGKTALLEFKLVSDDPDALKAALDGNVPEGYELKYAENEPVLIEKEAALTGDYLVTASVRFDQSRFNEPVVSLEFNQKGAKKFAEVTGENVGRRLAIVLDGEVQSAPRINERIPHGQAIITGRFSQEQANDLAIVLRVGALPAPLVLEEERTVGPGLGRDSIEKGVRSAIIGASLVIAFMAVYYLLSGVIAIFALLLNVLFVLAAMSYFKASLTLPGIAGIALTIGMSVDANVLIFERIREELTAGKSLQHAVSLGYKRAFLTIFDSNLTTLITAAVLFIFGSGPVRGFATTLSIGLLANIFTAVFVTRIVFDFLILNKKIHHLKFLQFLKKTPNIDFVKVRKYAYIFSITLIIIGMISLFMRGNKIFGIDFTGGTIQEFQFAKPVLADQVRKTLKEIGLGNSNIQQVKDTNRFIIRTYERSTDRLTAKFDEAFKDNKAEVLRIEEVGPVAGKELTRKAILSVIFSFIAIAIYVATRFEFKWGCAALLSLIHDVLIVFVALSLTNRELSLTVIAGILTLIGYSINDTIVIFDRMRENLRITRKGDLATIINLSINQTLSRTILTSLTVSFPIFALFFFGGEVINDFAFIFLIGLIEGVYSTVFIATPIILDWPKKKKA